MSNRGVEEKYLYKKKRHSGGSVEVSFKKYAL